MEIEEELLVGAGMDESPEIEIGQVFCHTGIKEEVEVEEGQKLEIDQVSQDDEELSAPGEECSVSVSENKFHYRCNFNSCRLSFKLGKSLGIHAVKSHLPPGNKPMTQSNLRNNYECIECGRKFREFTLLNTHWKYHWEEKPYPCPHFTCTRSFVTRKCLRNHLATHSSTKKFSCYFCARRFRVSNSLMDHLRIHTTEKPFKCNEVGCGKDFGNVKNLDWHKKVHLLAPDKQRLSCSKCSSQFQPNAQLGLKKHLAVCENSESFYKILDADSAPGNVITFKCLNCAYFSPRKDFIYDHVIRAHLQLKLYECLTCELKFCSKTELTTHSRTHTQDKTFHCKVPGCEARFFQSSQLQGHLATKHTTERKVKCWQCPKMFKTKGSMLSHLKLHIGEKSFKCDICGKQFVYSSSMLSHRKMHTTTATHALKCSICQMKQKNEACLKMHSTFCGNNDHFSISETPIPPHKLRPNARNKVTLLYRCNYCTKTSTRKDYIYDHVCRNHLNLKFLKCTESNCDAEFIQRSELASHMRQHNGDKPYECNLCGRRFTQKHSRDNHLRGVHVMEKAFKCPHCNKSFVRGPQLAVHMRQHTKEKPYFCREGDCKKSFTSNFSLTTHQNKYHFNRMDFICKDTNCGKRFVNTAALRGHMLTHSEVRRYKCTRCKVGFKTRMKLKQHETSDYHVEGTKPKRGCNRVTFYKDSDTDSQFD